MFLVNKVLFLKNEASRYPIFNRIKNTYNVHICLWDWHFYHSCLHIDVGIMFSILKNLSLTLRDTLERTPKVISNQNWFSRFQSWCWTAIQKMNSKDKAFLETFCVKESSTLIGLGNFGATGFSITAVLGQYFLHQSKSDQVFHIPSMKTLLPHYYLESEIKV